MSDERASLFPDFPQVALDYKGQVVSPCAVVKSCGPFLRVVIPVSDATERVRWVGRWRVIARKA